MRPYWQPKHHARPGKPAKIGRMSTDEELDVYIAEKKRLDAEGKKQAGDEQKLLRRVVGHASTYVKQRKNKKKIPRRISHKVRKMIRALKLVTLPERKGHR